MTTINDCKIIQLNKFSDRRGSLSVIENFSQVPFQIKRIFYLYDIPGQESRGSHSHLICHQFLISATGSFYVHVDDGVKQKQIYLNKPNIGLYIPPGIWASEVNFSSGSICLVLASHFYDENDYIRDYETFIS